METGYLVQRRRRSKAVPRDIFGNPTAPSGSQKSTSKPVPPTPKPPSQPPSKPPVKPPAKPPAKPPVTPAPPVKPEPVSEEVVEDDADDSNDETEVVNQQILRKPRKSIGLRPHTETVESEPVEVVSDRAQEIIEGSKERAKSDPVVSVEPEPEPVAETKPAPIKPRPRRPKSSSFQPANRAKRLDRSRHMEYKYEMRGLLEELSIADEHRSNLLGTIWARGERQTVADAKEFISEKCEQGVLTAEQESTLKGVVDRYTVRR